ncbi:hypothetical protein U1Q18_047369, partial [Sarracenia purpurea var. burkii]
NNRGNRGNYRGNFRGRGNRNQGRGVYASTQHPAFHPNPGGHNQACNHSGVACQICGKTNHTAV